MSPPVRPALAAVHRHPGARRLLATTLTFLALLATAACSDDGDSGATGADDTTTSTRPTTTEPADLGPSDELREEVQQLLHSYDELTRDIAIDPAVASDATNPLYDELRSLMAPDSEMRGPVVNALVARGARGVSQRPQGDAELPVERFIEGEIVSVSEDELRVPVCTHLNYGLFNSNDQQIELVRDRVEPADATVVRVDGEPRVSRFEGLDDDDRCSESEE